MEFDGGLTRAEPERLAVDLLRDVRWIASAEDDPEKGNPRDWDNLQ
jgi:hypothetical protein